MEFRETLLAAQRNQQQQSSRTTFYKAKFDPPKKEQKQRDKLSANIQKFLAKKDEEEKQKQLDAQKKKDDLFAMRDQKALRKIQKTLKVIKSANKSVIADAIDENNTAVTRDGPDQPDQDDYGYESQEAAALYEKMMQKYSKIPVEPKFPVGHNAAKKDLKGTMERVKHALQHEDDPVPHKRRRKGGTGVTDKEDSPTRYEPEKEKKKEEQAKSDKPKFRKPAPPPMDFNQLLKLAEQKKSEPIEVGAKKAVSVSESERPMTKRQRREYEEEMARKQRRLERLGADKGGKRIPKDPEHRPEKERPAGFGRIPKLGDKNSGNAKSDSSKSSEKADRDKHGSEKDKLQREIEKATLDKERLQRERDRLERERAERDSERIAKERLDQLKAERLKIERDIERLNRDRERLDKTKSRLENGIQSDKSSKNVTDRSKVNSRENGGKQDIKKNIDLKSQNTYRIDKNSNDRKFAIPSKTGNSNGKYTNEDSAQGRQAPKSNKNQPSQMSSKDRELMAKQKLATNGALKTNGRIENGKKPDPNKVASSKRPEEKASQGKLQAGASKPKVSGGFDFDKHINSIGAKIGKTNGARQFPPGDVRRKQQPDDRKKPKRRLDSDSEYDSEMDDFIDDGDENEDYSTHIKEIFGYDKSKYRYMDDDDDPSMESSFARQQREEYISKKLGIMEDLEDMRMEAMEKKKSKKKGGRRISDDED